MTIQEAVALVASASPPVLLAFALITGYLGWWYFGPVYKAMQKDRDEWKQIALDAVAITKQQAEQNKVLVDLAGRRR